MNDLPCEQREIGLPLIGLYTQTPAEEYTLRKRKYIHKKGEKEIEAKILISM